MKKHLLKTGLVAGTMAGMMLVASLAFAIDAPVTTSGETDALNAPGMGRITVWKKTVGGPPNTAHTFSFSVRGTGLLFPLNFPITVPGTADGNSEGRGSVSVFIPPLIPASFSVTENLTAGSGWREVATAFPCTNLTPGAGGN